MHHFNFIAVPLLLLGMFNSAGKLVVEKLVAHPGDQSPFYLRIMLSEFSRHFFGRFADYFLRTNK